MKHLKILQTSNNDCACASLLSIIHFYGGDIPREELSYLLNIYESGTNFYNILQASKKIGFNGYGIKAYLEDLLNYKIIFPCIAQVKNNNYFHFVVIYGINNKHVKIMDPAYGFIKKTPDEFKKVFLNNVLVLYPEKEIVKIKKTKPFKLFIKEYISLHKISFSSLILLSIVASIMSISLSFYLKLLIDNMSKIYLLKNICLTFILIIVIKQVTEYIRNIILIKFKYELNKDIHLKCISHIMNLPYHYFKSKTSGDILSRLRNLESIGRYVSSTIISIIINITFLVSSLLTIILINKDIFLIVLVICIVYIIVSIVCIKICEKFINKYKENMSIYYSSINQLINGYPTYKSLNLITTSIIDTSKVYNNYLLSCNNIEYRFNIHDLIKESYLIIFNFLITFFCILSKMQIGDVVLVNAIVLSINGLLRSLSEEIYEYKEQKINYVRINDLLQIRKVNIDQSNKSIISGDIVVSNLTFSHNSKDNLLDNINMIIHVKDKALIYGESGSGKSTLAKILLGYYDTYKGNITIGSKDIKLFGKEVILNSFKYVSQEDILFNGTLRDNICLNKKINEKKYDEITSLVHVSDIISKNKLKSEYLVNEFGFNLSGGERQKIILARCLMYFENNNYLILDEALSEINVEEEIEIIHNLFEYYKDKTIIYISHREELKEIFKIKYKI